MWATMNWVSWMYISTGVAAMNTPDRPPIVNIATNAMALSIGTCSRRLPRHIVPSQLNTFTAEGTEITSVEIMNDEPSVGFMPLMNMWWPHTIQPRKPIAMIANTIEWYPKIGLRLPFATMSDTMPIAGRMRM